VFFWFCLVYFSNRFVFLFLKENNNDVHEE